MKKRSFRSTFVSVILVITVAISIVNLAVYGINIKKIRQVEVLKMKTAGERIDDMITISLNNIKGLKQICCTDNYARNILLKNNEKNDIGTKFENQNYMDNALKHIASMDTLILRATIVNKYGNIYCTDTSIPEEYVKTIRNMTKEWMLFEGKEDEYYYGGLQGDNANILTFLYPLHTYGNTPIALLAVDINYKTFQSILENAFYEDSGECFILTGEQELFHIGEDLYQKEEKGYIFDKSQKMMKENLIVDTFQSKGKNFYISSRQNMLSGWKIIQVIPEERLFEEVDQKIKWNSKAKVKDILTYATENKFGVAAINTLNIETVKYVIEAAERERVPIIVQFYPGFSDYTDLKHLAFAACDMAEKASIPVGVHLDHSVTYEIAVGGIRDGFPSVMIDGSTKSFQENVELTKNVVRVAKVFGVDVEAELGHVGNGDSIDAIDNTNYYTKVEDAVRFVEQTGCDSLAIAVGNAHGPYVKTPNLDLERIYAIRKKVNIPLVLHGCSDIPEEQMKEAVNLGMSKFNIATEYFRTMYQSIEKRINNQEFEGNGVKLMYDIKEEMIDFVIQKIRLLNPNKYSM